MQAERRPNQPAGSFAENFFSFRGHRCGGLCLLGQERHRPKEPPARRSLIDSSILTPTGEPAEPAEPAVRNGGAAAISPRADDSECLGAKPVKPTPLCARAHNGETRGFSRNPRAITTTFETQLLQVVGGPGKLFLPVGAKTCFGGEAPMQQGRQACRPSDGPATLLSPMVATKACFAPPPPTLPRNRFCKSLVGKESCFFPSGPKLVLVGGLSSGRSARQTIRDGGISPASSCRGCLVGNFPVRKIFHWQAPIAVSPEMGPTQRSRKHAPFLHHAWPGDDGTAAVGLEEKRHPVPGNSPSRNSSPVRKPRGGCGSLLRAPPRGSRPFPAALLSAHAWIGDAAGRFRSHGFLKNRPLRPGGGLSARAQREGAASGSARGLAAAPRQVSVSRGGFPTARFSAMLRHAWDCVCAHQLFSSVVLFVKIKSLKKNL